MHSELHARPRQDDKSKRSAQRQQSGSFCEHTAVKETGALPEDSRVQAVLDVGQRGQVAILAGVDVVKGVHKGRQLAGLGRCSTIQRQSKRRQSSLCKVGKALLWDAPTQSQLR